MKIFRKINVQIFSLVLVLIFFQLVISALSYFSIKTVNNGLVSVFEKRLPSIDNLVQADRDFQQALVAERTLLMDGLSDKEYASLVKDYDKNRKQVIERFSTFAKLAATEEEKKLIESFTKKYESWAQFSDKNLPILKVDYKGSRKDYVEKSLHGASKLFEDSRGDLDALQEFILNYADKEFEGAQETYNSSVKELILALIIGLLSSGLLSFFIVRNITKKISFAVKTINGNKDDLNNISENLSNKSVELSSIAQEQSASVEETSSSLHEISQMVKKNTDIAVNSADMVGTGKNQLSEGIGLIFKLAERIKDVNQASQDLGKSVDENHTRLSEILGVFNEIQSKTSVINDIVFQTKLLSFNASVEAARAGEHGKGFAVVAEEIGGLAQQSGKSANEISTELDNSFGSISGIIQRSKDEVFAGVNNNKSLIEECLNLSQECESVLQKISTMFESISSSSIEIADASKEQSVGVEEINSAVQEINDSNQVTAQRSNEVENLSRNIHNVSELLSESIEELNKMI
ncbi:methyl-accepting chemotaxis protein [Bacteriovorax sp. Seq25_V]|uniref:HAMP domain-containing methyl-accepting chemotaxis protein n=1 Tax=Bacteriovorax sp. Seq25_V TaxID=1201288 RepID=UPI00038A1C0F|nr:methyl-accepting chemotaxis protein [Bacteriovorax sp. Seq25_V]EQC44042.1 signal transduction four helix bundle sensory module [Bacteriovorax sp. Seq25_V]